MKVTQSMSARPETPPLAGGSPKAMDVQPTGSLNRWIEML